MAVREIEHRYGPSSARKVEVTTFEWMAGFGPVSGERQLALMMILGGLAIFSPWSNTYDTEIWGALMVSAGIPQEVLGASLISFGMVLMGLSGSRHFCLRRLIILGFSLFLGSISAYSFAVVPGNWSSVMILCVSLWAAVVHTKILRR